MITALDSLRELTLASIALRMLLAVVCGGLVGLERENKRRPAGFRTHILICLGACMTTLTGQYLYVYMHYHTDMARLGAQVIAGIGFIGAGTIIVTKQRRVRGLTTAAGLWTSAIVGLCCGAGYYEGVLAGTVLILAAELVLSKLEHWFTSHDRELNLYVKYSGPETMDGMVRLLKDMGVKILDLEITKPEREEDDSACAIFLLRPEHKLDPKELERGLSAVDGVCMAQRL